MEDSHGFIFHFVIAIILATLPHKTESKWVEGTVKTNSDWIFLTRFCFLSRAGNMNYFLEYPIGYGVENMAFYYDVPGQWYSVYQQDLTCDEKLKVLKGKNVFPLLDEDSMCTIETRKSQDWYVCAGDIDFSSARERWWFVVLSKCGSPNNFTDKGMYLHYKLHMTNGDDLLHKEFSADEFYILIVDIIFLGLYFILLVLSIVILKMRRLLHTTNKLYLISVAIWTVSLLCLVIAWGYYGATGWKIRPLEDIGRILQMCSNVVFILVLILLAKGLSYIRGSLTNKAVFKITVFLTLYVAAMVVMFVWENILFDPGLVLYYYESPPGYGMITVILIGWLWFTKSAVFTLKHYSSKTKFYIIFYSIYTIWFWASPFVILIAMFAMAKWTREKTVNGVQQLIAFIGHLLFLILTTPHKANNSFLYQVRTPQTGTVSGRDKENFRTDSHYVQNTKVSTSDIDQSLDIVMSKSFTDDDDSNGLMLDMPTESSSSSGGAVLSSFSQTAHADRLLPAASNIPSDSNSNNSISRENKQIHSSTSAQFTTFDTGHTDESNIHF